MICPVSLAEGMRGGVGDRYDVMWRWVVFVKRVRGLTEECLLQKITCGALLLL